MCIQLRTRLYIKKNNNNKKKYTQGLTEENTTFDCMFGSNNQTCVENHGGGALSASKVMRQPLQDKQWGHVTQKLHTGRTGSQLSHKSM